MVRESESDPGGYALSVRDRDRVKHYKIHQSDNQEFYITARCIFNSLQALVIHYQQQADGLCVNLRNPCAFTPTDVSGEPVDEWETDKSGIRLVRKV